MHNLLKSKKRFVKSFKNFCFEAQSGEKNRKKLKPNRRYGVFFMLPSDTKANNGLKSSVFFVFYLPQGNSKEKKNSERQISQDFFIFYFSEINSISNNAVKIFCYRSFICNT